MRYIINENKVHLAIYKYIDNLFTEDNISYDYGYNYDTDKTDKNILNFFGDKYTNNEQDDWYFEYVKKEWYENISDDDNEKNEFKNKWLEKSPLLEILDIEFPEKMTSMFGSYWKPIFEKWFKDTYPQFPDKTFIY